MNPWVKYSLIRLTVFAAVLAILIPTEVPVWLAAVIAAVIGLCVAYIFFGKLRDEVAMDIQRRREGKRIDSDSSAEDRASEL